MKREATEEQVKKIVDHIEKEGFKVSVDQGTKRVVIGLKGDAQNLQEGTSTRYEGIEDAVRILSIYKLTSREFHPGNTVVGVDGIRIDDDSSVMMTSPCSVEGLDQTREYAWMAKTEGAKILRGGTFKPHTSPYAFQGLEEEGLKYIRQTVDEFRMKVITEMMDEGYIDMVAEYSDILQVGARNMQNFGLLSAVGKTDKPVGLRRGISGVINEWLSAAEYIAVGDRSPVIFIEHGIRTYETAAHNAFNLSAAPLMKKLTHFPVIVDPGCGTGIWGLIPPMAHANVANGADDVIVEIHPDSANAWSDGSQSLNEETYSCMMKEVTVMKGAMEEVQTLD